MHRLHLVIVMLLAVIGASAQSADPKLTGKVIGTTMTYDYNKGQSSTTVNTAANCFDGDLSTYFATNARHNTWAGLDLGTPHVITRVGWSPRNDGVGPKRVQLAVFEGANRADFMDAVPLYIVPDVGTIGTVSHADLTATQAFRYVRYVGPHDARCNVAEVEFYGHEGDVVTFDPEEGEANRTEPGLYALPANIPVVSIHTVNAQEPYDKVHEIEAVISVISEDKILTDTATIRFRGNGSLGFDKKPYRIKWDEKHRVLDSPAKAKKWTLINNYGDKTLMRNMLAFELSRRFGMPYTPFCTPVDVFLNGEYKGNYQLCDQVEVKKNRVDIEEMDETCITGDALTGGYFVEIDAYSNEEPVHFNSNKWNPVTIKSPDEDIIQQAQRTYITNYFNQMEAAVYSGNYDNCSQWLDVDSFLRHFLIGELSGNTDTYWSVYLYKPRGDAQFHCGPVWDFDLAFENDYRTYPICNKGDWVYRSGGSLAGDMKRFVDNIANGSKGTAMLRKLWADARCNSDITEASLLEYVDECAALLDESQRLNFIRWPILNQQVHMNYKAFGTYAAEVNVVKAYIKNRIAWMDRKLVFDASLVGIDALYADSETPDATADGIYTIEGRRVQADNATLKPGIYIVNGRKVVR